MDKEATLKEKFKIALISTIKVISEKDKVEVDFSKWGKVEVQKATV